MSWMRDDDNDTGSISTLYTVVVAGFRRLNERLDKIEADMTTIVKEQTRKDIIETLEAYDEHMCGPDLYSAIQHLKDQT